MNPVHDTPAAQPTVTDPRELTRALIAAFAAIVLAGSVLAGIALFTSQPATPMDGASTDSGEVRDGWSSYLGAAAEPAERPVVDGWSSYLLKPELDPATVRDGWSSYLLVTEHEAPVVDGWMVRYGQDH
ncbi:MAG: hypothetical protein M3Y40_00245 [Chloroflexota bacterium]|nr:hypothetical protein [Chloroflexota bacterium]